MRRWEGVGLPHSFLTVFTQISGRNFFPELCGEVHPEPAPPSSVLCSFSDGREWGVGSVVVESAFLGRPDFSPKGPNPCFEGFRSDVGQKSGAPQTQIQRPRIQRPIFGTLILLFRNTALFEGEKRAKRCREKERNKGGQKCKRGHKGKKDVRKKVSLVQQTGVYPYPLVAGSARPNPKMGAPDPENLYF